MAHNTTILKQELILLLRRILEDNTVWHRINQFTLVGNVRGQDRELGSVFPAQERKFFSVIEFVRIIHYSSCQLSCDT